MSPWGLTRHPPWWPRPHKPRPGVGQGECLPSVCPVLPSVCPRGFDQRFFSVESCFSNLLTRVRRTTRLALFLVFCLPRCLPSVCPELEKNLPSPRKSCLLTKTCTPNLPLFFLHSAQFCPANSAQQTRLGGIAWAEMSRLAPLSQATKASQICKAIVQG